jgi:alpha-L-fucosidase
MKNSLFKLISKSLVAVLSAILAFSSVYSQTFAPTWESLGKYKCPEWYKDAKFGIFIHWGVYSVPEFGSEWYPHWM